MDFKWTLSRPGIELEFETGSIKEAIGILEQKGSQISEVFGFTMGGAASAALSTGTVETGTTDVAGKKERKSRKGADPATAVAPDPLPVPGAAPVAPTVTTLPPNALTIPADGGIPDFLQRTEAPALAAAPPPPPVLPSPPVAPAPPPVGVLGPKVVAALDAHRVGKADGGQALADWLAHPDIGLTIKGATFDEACRSVLMTSDEKLKAVAGMLKVAA